MIKYKKGNDFFLEKITRTKYSDIVAYQKNAVHRNFSKKETKALMGDSYTDYEHHYQFKLDKNDLNTCMKMDLSNVIPGDYMVKDDRISMMHSIELRTPFLDKDLVEFCATVPWQYKLSESNTKLMLRKVFGDWLTENILNKKKQGFGAPISDWLKFAEMEKKTQEILKNKSSKIFGTINFEEVQKKLNYDYKHWSLLVLGIWMEEHL
jgi:asparagine synthase (glutamine-hydrolysing)